MAREVIRGKFIEKSRGASADKILGKLAVELIEYCEDVGSGIILQNQPHAFHDPKDFLVIPDIAFHWNRYPSAFDYWIETVPDLIIECFGCEDHVSVINDRIGYYVKEGSTVWHINVQTYQVGIRKYAEATRFLNIGELLEDAEILPGFSFKIPSP